MECIFGNKLKDKDFCLYLQRKWKIRGDSIISITNNDSRVWARDADKSAINASTQEQRFQIKDHDLKLILLFKHAINNE